MSEQLRRAAQQALEALELAQTDVHWELNSPMRKFLRKAEKSLHAALAPPEHELEWDEVFDAAVRAWKARTPGRDALRLCFQDKSDDSEIFTDWTSRELMDFAEGIASIYTTSAIEQAHGIGAQP